MFKPTPSKPVLFSVACKRFKALRGIAVVTFISVGLALTFASSFLFTHPSTAYATTNNTLNFQARLEDANGAIVPDGNYAIEFKLYDASSSSGSSQGSCTGDSACLWTETRTGANQVHVANGYLSVNLGSVTAFPNTINWDQSLYLTMNIFNPDTASWDGEMNPRLTLTGVPYAFRAGELATGNGTYSSTLSLLQPSAGNQTFQLPDFAQAGTNVYGLLALQSTGTVVQQTGSFNISGTGIVGALEAGTVDTASNVGLFIGNTNATGITLGNTGLNDLTTIYGSALVKSATGLDSATTFQVQSSTSSTPVLDVDTANGRVGIGTASPSRALDVAINNTTTTAPGMLLEQAGTGDADLELKTPTGSWMAGVDQSDSNKFKISSSAADNLVNSFGKQTQGATTDTGNQNTMACTKYSASATGTVTSLNVYINNANNGDLFSMAIYDATGTGGNPGTKLGASSNATISTNGWYSVAVSASVTASTPYWLCYNTNGTSTLDNTTYDAGSTNQYAHAGQVFGTWPTTFGTVGGNGNIADAVYATVSASSYDSFATSLFTLTSSGQATFQNATNSTTAFQVQDASGNTVLTADTSGDVVDVGSTSSLIHPAQLYVKNTNPNNRAMILQAASGQASGIDILDLYNGNGQFVSGYDVNGNEFLNGSLTSGYYSSAASHAAGTVKIEDGTVNKFGVSLTTPTSGLSNSIILYLPVTGATASGQCLQSGSGSTTSSTTLQFSSCGSTTLQQAYNASAGASPSIKLTSSLGALTVQNDDTTGSPITGNLFAVRDENNAGSLLSVANTGATTIRTGNATNNYDTTTAFQVQNHNATDVLDVDTSNGNVGIGTNAPSRTLDVAVNNTQVAAPMALLEQAGTGDSSLEFKDPNNSFYVGQDTSSSEALTISSGYAATHDRSSGSPYVLGYNSITHTFEDSGNNGLITSMPFTTTVAGTLSQINVDLASDNPGDDFAVAIYADSGANHPGALIASSPSTPITITTEDGDNWNTATLSSTVSLTATTKYWLAYETNDNGVAYWLDETKGDVCWQTISGSFGSWTPTNTTTCDGGFNANTYGIYGMVTPTGSSHSLSDTFSNPLFTLAQDGSATFQGMSDSTSAFQVQGPAGDNVLQVNTTLGSVEVASDIDTINNNNLAIGDVNATGVDIGNTGADNLTTIYGSALVKSAAGLDSTTAFQVQDSGGAPVLGVDTAGDTVSLDGATTVTGTNTFTVSGGLTSLQDGLTVTGAATTISGGAFTVGTTSMSSAITLGKATSVSSTINIGDGAIASAKTQTINIGAGALAGAGSDVVTIGSVNGASSLTLQGGTGNVSVSSGGNISIDTTGSGTLSLGTTHATTTIGNSSSALTLQGSNFSVNPSTGNAILTNTGAGASVIADRTDGVPISMVGGTNGNIRFSSSASFIIQSQSSANIIAGNSTGLVGILTISGGAPANSLTVDASGDLGIDTSTPGYTLDVAGDINTSTLYRVGGTPGKSSLNCGTDQSLNNVTIKGGIVTAGSCTTGGSWTNLTPLSTGFSAGTDVNGTSDPPAFRLLPDGDLELRGDVNVTANYTSPATFSTHIPSGDWPTTLVISCTVMNTIGNTPGQVILRPNGNLQIHTNNYSSTWSFSLDGCTLPLDGS